MAYSAITNPELDQDSPITQTLMTKYRDNIIFAAESIWHPYNRAEPDGSETGIFYDHGSDGTVSTIETPDFVAGYDYRVLFDDLDYNGNGLLQVAFFKVTDAAYSVAQAIDPTTTESGLSGELYIPLPQWSKNGQVARWMTMDDNNNGNGGFVNSGDGQSQAVSKVRFSITNTRDFTAGRMALLRRRVLTPF